MDRKDKKGNFGGGWKTIVEGGCVFGIYMVFNQTGRWSVWKLKSKD
jgi:hypothetical protein